MNVQAQVRILVCILVLGVVAGCASTPPGTTATDPLPSWNDGDARTAILEFVAAVTDPEGEDYVEPAERIAVFDNDGTLWLEYPVYTQLLFAFDRVKELAPQHPEWQTTQPFQAVLESDKQALDEAGMKGLMQIVAATHSGMMSEEFEQMVADWLATTTEERFERLFTELVYQPQLELLDYLRAHGFKTFIVSGGGSAFMRPWTERVYGIPREQVVGSSSALEYRVEPGKTDLLRLPEVGFIDDKEGKPVGIQVHIGRRPILAFGNSDGDFEMVQYTTNGDGRRLGLFVHHTDASREYAYDRESRVGKLDKALDAAEANGWILVDMKDDWARIFPDD